MPKCSFCRAPDAKLKPTGKFSFFCNLECFQKKGVKLLKKVGIDRSKAARKDLKEFNRVDVAWQHKTCQPVFNRSRVLEELQWFDEQGIEPYCISCGKTKMDWCCGHYKTVGSARVIRYDRVNTYLQCNRYCNKALSGNIEGNKTTHGYKQGLLSRFGKSKGQEIMDYCAKKQHEKRKWTWQEVEQIKIESSEISRKIKKTNG